MYKISPILPIGEIIKRQKGQPSCPNIAKHIYDGDNSFSLLYEAAVARINGRKADISTLQESIKVLKNQKQIEIAQTEIEKLQRGIMDDINFLALHGLKYDDAQTPLPGSAINLIG